MSFVTLVKNRYAFDGVSLFCTYSRHWNIIHFRLLPITLGVVLSLPLQAADVPKNWKALESELAATLKASDNRTNAEERVFLTQMLLSVPAAASLKGTNDLAVFNQMTAQSDCPLVAFTGFVLAEKLSHDKAFFAACNTITQANNPTFLLFGAALEYLQRVPPVSESCLDAFTAILKSSPKNDNKHANGIAGPADEVPTQLVGTSP